MAKISAKDVSLRKHTTFTNHICNLIYRPPYYSAYCTKNILSIGELYAHCSRNFKEMNRSTAGQFPVAF